MKNLLLYLVVLLFFMPTKIFAQKDTIFINKDFNRLEGRYGAAFYQIAEKQERKKFLITQYWSDNTLKMQGTATEKFGWGYDGDFVFYYHNGQKQSSGPFTKGRKNGLWKYYDTLGRLIRESQFDKGSLNDTERWYHPENGTLSDKYLYDHGTFVAATKYDTNGKEIKESKELVKSPDLKYANGLTGFLVDNLNYPPDEREAGIQGAVYVRLRIDSFGKLKEYEIIKSLSVSCDREVVRLFGIMPDWVPAMQNEKPVEFKSVIPISFRVE